MLTGFCVSTCSPCGRLHQPSEEKNWGAEKMSTSKKDFLRSSFTKSERNSEFFMHERTDLVELRMIHFTMRFCLFDTMIM